MNCYLGQASSGRRRPRRPRPRTSRKFPKIDVLGRPRPRPGPRPGRPRPKNSQKSSSSDVLFSVLVLVPKFSKIVVLGRPRPRPRPHPGRPRPWTTNDRPLSLNNQAPDGFNTYREVY